MPNIYAEGYDEGYKAGIKVGSYIPNEIIKEQKKRISELEAELDDCKKINTELRETLRHYTINMRHL